MSLQQEKKKKLKPHLRGAHELAAFYVTDVWFSKGCLLFTEQAWVVKCANKSGLSKMDDAIDVCIVSQTLPLPSFDVFHVFVF